MSEPATPRRDPATRTPDGRDRAPVLRPVPGRQRPDPLLRTLEGAALRRARHRQGLTLTRLAARSGVSLAYLSEIERGRKEASSEILADVCSALGIGLSDLLRDCVLDLTTRNRDDRLRRGDRPGTPDRPGRPTGRGVRTWDVRSPSARSGCGRRRWPTAPGWTCCSRPERGHAQAAIRAFRLPITLSASP